MARKISQRGRAMIERFEGCALTAYLCPANVLTIGYGHTGPDVVPGMTITAAQADTILSQDLSKFEAGVELILEPPPANDNQFAALVSFAFNLGLRSLLKSTLMKKHKAGDYQGAAGQFLSWVKARKNGQLVTLPGLVARREMERRLYLEPV